MTDAARRRIRTVTRPERSAPWPGGIRTGRGGMSRPARRSCYRETLRVQSVPRARAASSGSAAGDPDQPRLRRGPRDAARRRRRGCRRGSGTPVLLKREDLQPVFSFKLRGAYNRIAHLVGGRAARAASSPPAPATTPRAWPTPRGTSASRALIVMPADDAGHQGARGARPGRRGGAGRRQLRRRAGRAATSWPRDRARRSSTRSTTRWSSPARARSASRSCGISSAADVGAIFVPVGGGGLIAGIAGYVKAHPAGCRASSASSRRMPTRWRSRWPPASA